MHVVSCKDLGGPEEPRAQSRQQIIMARLGGIGVILSVSRECIGHTFSFATKMLKFQHFEINRNFNKNVEMLKKMLQKKDGLKHKKYSFCAAGAKILEKNMSFLIFYTFWMAFFQHFC